MQIKGGEKMKRKILVMIVFLVSLALFVGCNNGAVSKNPENSTIATDSTSNESTTENESTDESGESYEGLLAWYYPFPHVFGEGCKAGVESYVKETGIPINIMIGPDFTQESENERIEALLSMGYKYFGIFGVDGAGSNGLYQEIVDAGGIANNLGWDSTQPTPASHLISTDIGKSAEMGMEYLAEQMGYKGKVMACYGPIVDTTFPTRQNAVNSVIEKYPDMEIAVELTDMITNEDALMKMEDGITSHKGEIDGIISLGANSSTAACTILDEMYAKGAERMVSVLIDIDDTISNAIKDGIIDATIVQNEYGIGYISGEVLKLQADGYRPKEGFYHIDTGIVVVTKDNIDDYSADLEKVTQEILSTLTTVYMQKSE